MANCEPENANDASQNQNDVTAKSFARLRKAFNRNRKIVLRNVPDITVEVMKRAHYGIRTSPINRPLRSTVLLPMESPYATSY